MQDGILKIASSGAMGIDCTPPRGYVIVNSGLFQQKDLFLLPTQPLPILTLYTDAFRYWQTHFSSVFFLAVVCTAIPIFTSQFTLNELTLTVAIQHVQTNHPAYLNDILCVLSNILLSMGSYALLLIKINSLVTQQPLSATVLLKKTLIKIPFLLLTLIIAGVSLMLGSLAFVLPGFYILGVLFVFYPLVILGSNNVFKDFILSFQLTQKNWWRTLIVLALPVILLTSFSNLVANFIALFFQHAIVNLLVRALTQTLIMSFLAIWISMQTILLLNDLKLRIDNYS